MSCFCDVILLTSSFSTSLSLSLSSLHPFAFSLHLSLLPPSPRYVYLMLQASLAPSHTEVQLWPPAIWGERISWDPIMWWLQEWLVWLNRGASPINANVCDQMSECVSDEVTPMVEIPSSQSCGCSGGLVGKTMLEDGGKHESYKSVTCLQATSVYIISERWKTTIYKLQFNRKLLTATSKYNLWRVHRLTLLPTWGSGWFCLGCEG